MKGAGTPSPPVRSQHPVVRICQHSGEAGCAMYPGDTCHVTPMLTSADDISLSSEPELATCPGRTGVMGDIVSRILPRWREGDD